MKPTVDEVEAHFGDCRRLLGQIGWRLVNRARGVWLVQYPQGGTRIEYWPTSGKWRDTDTGKIHHGKFTHLDEYLRTRCKASDSRDEQSVLE